MVYSLTKITITIQHYVYFNNLANHRKYEHRTQRAECEFETVLKHVDVNKTGDISFKIQSGN